MLPILSPEKPSPYNFSLTDWKEWVEKQGLPSFTGGQIYQWIFQKGVINPLEFSNLSQNYRKNLADSFNWDLPKIASRLISQDQSQKCLLSTHDGLLYEMVLMIYENRATLCMSSQVGCKMGCTFCQTGKMGFKRNLTSGEILTQVLLANQFLEGKEQDKISNIVFMGMGEPLDNYEEVVKACRILIDPNGFGLSKHRVTISTSGLVPEILRLAQDLPVRLAISLHATTDEKRNKIMPVNRKYPLAVLKEALMQYPAPKRYGITFEYVMIHGVNDTLQDARELVRFLHGLKAKINLIPFNNFPGNAMETSQLETIKAFQAYLTHRSFPAPVRYSRAQDVSGGCGQLAAKHEEELNMDPREIHKARRKTQKVSI